MRERKEIEQANQYDVVHVTSPYVGQRRHEPLRTVTNASHVRPLELEILLDQRDLLTEIRDLLKERPKSEGIEIEAKIISEKDGVGRHHAL